MNRKKLLKFLKESKTLLPNASLEQKIKIINLLKESTQYLKSEQQSKLDYLDEK